MPDIGDGSRQRLALVTGASRGIGAHILAGLVAAGFEVLAPTRAELDLSSSASVRHYTSELLADGRAIDVLVLNAGIFAPRTPSYTPDGYELQWQTNLLGHVALTALLFPLLRNSPVRQSGARVVAQTSLSAQIGRLPSRVLSQAAAGPWTEGAPYRPISQYARSKIGLGLFACELDRRSREHGWGISAAVAHPGAAATDIAAASGFVKSQHRSDNWMIKAGLIQTARDGAGPAVLAARATDAGGRFYGPGGLIGSTGRPAERRLWRVFRDRKKAARLWTLLEAQAGACFPR
ncbi:SDR family NAD(P)-dependent oxidoreductase [Microbacterium album]|uniref:Short-chain dehydrogenase/reductase n=1 Tax=Microbacterium album TaxID=2053191 RepID=A0A917IGZ5_9MICO|nr:SDR family NAD(P)-dependent oxidoreductase [Microbacterium album]GGH45934.1 putative short-chain dehydrogenase/reductase [Microbacterium album]